MIAPLLLALAAGLGVHLLWSALALGQADLVAPRPPGHQPPGRRARRRGAAERWLRQAGLDGVGPAEFLAVTLAIATVGAAVGYALFASPLPALALGGFAAAAPLGLYRQRRRHRLERAQEAWPQLIEEIRILTGSVGRSIPQALFQAGRHAPAELRPAFEAAQREWLITTDFERTVSVLKAHAADPTADATCETLLVAHELGGTDLGRRLEALAEDRLLDLNARRDARAKQAGVRFARLFVLLVPLGMTLAGLSIGDARGAYRSPLGQVLVTVGLGVVVLCWVWAGRFLRLPEDERVFDR